MTDDDDWHIISALRELHWLLIRFSIQFNIMTIFYKAFHNAPPDYIWALIELKQSKYSLRSVNVCA